VDKRSRSSARHKKSSHFQMKNCGEAEKSSHFKMTNCGQAGNEVQQRTKKSSHFQFTNRGQVKPKSSNAPKNLLNFK